MKIDFIKKMFEMMFERKNEMGAHLGTLTECAHFRFFGDMEYIYTIPEYYKEMENSINQHLDDFGEFDNDFERNEQYKSCMDELNDIIKLAYNMGMNDENTMVFYVSWNDDLYLFVNFENGKMFETIMYEQIFYDMNECKNDFLSMFFDFFTDCHYYDKLENITPETFKGWDYDYNDKGVE